MQPRLLPAALALALLAAPAWAKDEVKRLGRQGAWESFAYADGGGKVCYAAASADRTQGGEKKRAATVIIVTHRPAAKTVAEMSVLGAYGFKKGAAMEIQIGGKSFPLFSQGDRAWGKDAAQDKAMVAALTKARDAVIRAVPAKGQAIADTVPLAGLPQALAVIDKACGVKR